MRKKLISKWICISLGTNEILNTYDSDLSNIFDNDLSNTYDNDLILILLLSFNIYLCDFILALIKCIILNYCNAENSLPWTQ